MPLFLFYLLLLILQGFLAALFSPSPVPDLFIIMVLSLGWRLPRWQFILLAYAIGLLQDMMGYGNLGLHALGLASAAFVVSLLRLLLHQRYIVEQLLMVVAALLTKWLAFTLLMFWLEVEEPWRYLQRTAPLELLLTLIFASILLPFAYWLIERQGILRKDLL